MSFERVAHVSPGPQFELIDGVVMFSYVIDPSNVLGPRPAKKAEQEKYAGEWQAFCDANKVSPLDRDADGKDGGSLPAAEPVVVSPTIETVDPEVAELRQQLTDLGVKFHHKAKADKLRKQLDEATAPKA